MEPHGGYAMSREREAYRARGHVSETGAAGRASVSRHVIHGKPAIQGKPVAQLKEEVERVRVARARTSNRKAKRAPFPNRVLLLLMLPFLVMLVWSLNAINTRGNEYQAASSEYAVLRELARPEHNGALQEMPLAPTEEVDNEDVCEGTVIDFDALRAINPDIVGWIVVPGTTIDYPVVQGRDNEWYLHRTFRGERNSAGAIFIDYLNAPDFSDGHTLVFGHNMQRGNMFAPLHGWDGDRFRIYTPDGVLEFEVFARQTVPRNSPLYSLFDSPKDDGAQVVTLSTCMFRRPAYRFVVRGRLSG